MDSGTKLKRKSCGKWFYWSGTVTGLGAGFLFAAIYTGRVPVSESGDILRVIGFLLMITGIILTNRAANRAKNIPRPFKIPD